MGRVDGLVSCHASLISLGNGLISLSDGLDDL
jgi:hypothetical protein